MTDRYGVDSALRNLSVVVSNMAPGSRSAGVVINGPVISGRQVDAYAHLDLDGEIPGFTLSAGPSYIWDAVVDLDDAVEIILDHFDHQGPA